MRIAYVIPAYPPVTSQPFVVNEMVEVQEAGHPLVVLGLHRGAGEPVRHGTFERLRPEHVLPPVLCDWRTLALALWVTITRPVRVLRALAGLHWEAGRRPWAQAAKPRPVVAPPTTAATGSGGRPALCAAARRSRRRPLPRPRGG